MRSLGDVKPASLATPCPTTRRADYSRFDDCVEPILGRMSLREKVGQMTQAELSELTSPDEVRELRLGSVMNGGNTGPPGGNDFETWTEAYNTCQREALATPLAVPILFGVDAIHGHNNVLGAVIFPHNIGLGCANDPDLVERVARATAREVRATGIQWNFSPCVAVPRDDRWGRTYEGFSEDPEHVTRLTTAAVRGLQTDDLSSSDAVVACAKHFIGDGGTEAERRESQFQQGLALCLDRGDVGHDDETLRRLFLSPYRAAVDAGVATVMPSYSSVRGVKCTGSYSLLTELLKGELGFEGFVVSDYDAIDEIHPDYKTAIKTAVNAGVDMAMAPTRYRTYIQLLTELVEDGGVPIERINDAVRRILRVKAAAGLLYAGDECLAATEGESRFGSYKHREVARDAVRRSLVVLKNDGALPLEPHGVIDVVGTAADDLGIQCGGWTIEWQGESGEVTSGGTTVLEGLRSVVGERRVRYAADPADVERAESIVAVIGELPYAEGFGDDEHLRLRPQDARLLAKCMQTKGQLIVVILSGRPLVLDDELVTRADAVVAAWLPGTEGAGIADVLTGLSPPTAKLSVSWPRGVNQRPMNIGDADYDPLFPYGHGLEYESDCVAHLKAKPR